MRFLVILNRDGGTLKTTDLDALSAEAETILSAGGHQVAVEIVAGKDVEKALGRAAERDDVDVVIAGGGDGTVSTAAGLLAGSAKALAILPAGTMNLFARSLGVPLALGDALAAFASGRVVSVDIARANGRPFVHQFSIGLHAKMVHVRERYEYRSRIGKMWASTKAGWAAALHPPSMKVTLDVDGRTIDVTTAGVSISNNLFGEGHLPYADKPDGGTLGIYVASAVTRLDVLKVLIATLIGRWRSSDQMALYEGRRVSVTVRSKLRRWACVMDGEICQLQTTTLVEVDPGTLRVLVPADAPMFEDAPSAQT